MKHEFQTLPRGPALICICIFVFFPLKAPSCNGMRLRPHNKWSPEDLVICCPLPLCLGWVEAGNYRGLAVRAWQGRKGIQTRSRGPHELSMVLGFPKPQAAWHPQPQPFACCGRTQLGQSSGVTSGPLWGSVSPMGGRAGYYRGDHRNQGKRWKEQTREAPESCWALPSCSVFHPRTSPGPMEANHRALCAQQPSLVPVQLQHRLAAWVPRSCLFTLLDPQALLTAKGPPQLGLRDTLCCRIGLGPN